MPSVIGSALLDIGEAFRRRAVWIALAKEDIGDQHKSTTLGPLWMLVNYLAFAGTFVMIFGGGADNAGYAAFASIGLFVWLYMSETITQSTTLFTREAAFIRGTTLPLTTYVLRLTLQSVIRSAYALAGCLGILLFVGLYPTPIWAWSLIGMGIVVLATPPVIIIFAIAGAYFPDLRFVVQNLMRLGIFLTPIFWGHDKVSGTRAAIYQWNPFTYFLEVVRMPITEGAIPVGAYFLCLLVTAVAWMLGIYLLGKSRKQIVFVI